MQFQWRRPPWQVEFGLRRKVTHVMSDANNPSSMAPCVVLAAADRALDGRLPGCIADKGWSSRIEHDTRMAFAEACLVRRTLQLQHAWDDEVVALPGLLVVDPDGTDDLQALQDAVREHVPDLPLWRWNGEEILPLNQTASRTAAQPEPEDESDIPPSYPFRPEPLTHDEVSMLLHGRPDPETP